MNRETNTQVVMQFLSRHGEMFQSDADSLGIKNLSAEISRLRKEGIAITTAYADQVVRPSFWGRIFGLKPQIVARITYYVLSTPTNDYDAWK